MKVDLEKLAELKANLAAMDRGLEEIVIRAVRETTRLAQNTRSNYPEHKGVKNACDDVISTADKLRNQGDKLSWILREKVKGLERAIELYHASETMAMPHRNIFTIWRNSTFARAFKINWIMRFPGLSQWVKNATSYGENVWRDLRAVPGMIGFFNSMDKISLAKATPKAKNLATGSANFMQGVNLSGVQYYLGMAPYNESMNNSSWAVNALNRSWGPINKSEYNKRMSELVAKGIGFGITMSKVEDKTYSKTFAGTDNMKNPASNAKLNIGRAEGTKYDGGLGGHKGEVYGVQAGAELLQFDNKANWFGFNAGVEVNTGVAKGGLYAEKDKGAFGSAGAGAYVTLKEGNVHAKMRFDELNIYVNVGANVAGVGAMAEGSVWDKRSDGTTHLLSADGLLEFIVGANANIDIYLKDR